MTHDYDPAAAASPVALTHTLAYDWFPALSFLATIGFGLLALAGLLLAGLWSGLPQVVACALLAAGAAYLAQMVATHAQDSRRAAAAVVLQLVSLWVWALGVWFYLRPLIGA